MSVGFDGRRRVLPPGQKIYCSQGHEQTWGTTSRYNEKRYTRRRCMICAEQYRVAYRKKHQPNAKPRRLTAIKAAARELLAVLPAELDGATEAARQNLARELDKAGC